MIISFDVLVMNNLWHQKLRWVLHFVTELLVDPNTSEPAEHVFKDYFEIKF